MNQEPIESEPDENAPRLPRRRRRSKRRVIGFFGSLLMLLLLIAFGPAIVAVTPLRDWVLGKISSSEQGTIAVDRRSRGGFARSRKLTCRPMA